ncbi:MAG: hypothetical protein WC829_11440 [Hyphomicrobium sp.]|jgi:hypothetical protein
MPAKAALYQPKATVLKALETYEDADETRELSLFVPMFVTVQTHKFGANLDEMIEHMAAQESV